ncbi:patatin-like phospholipase family protein [Aquipuribacter nitratireducens]|uniref:Patatin-like phospholipase family protein n=1 Tax=Aquipuribacter nitratireducens TaxID=650104 RepID=A0ABW0GK94_9MICO
MSPRSARRGRTRGRGGRPSWGLVLGGGGVLGGAWMVGALTAYEEVSGRDCRDADVIIGTSVGAFAAALLGAGASVADWRAHQEGRAVRHGPMAGLSWDYDVDSGGATPPTPGRRPGSPGLVTSGVRRLRRLPPTAVLSGLVPEGRGSMTRIGETVDGLLGGRDWVRRRGVRVVALDYDSGHRTVFAGPTDQPDADRHRRHTVRGARLPDAVMASCAIPGWYAPVRIGDHRYVDGGAWSSTNVDLVAADHLDEVVVVAPMVCFAPDRPRSFAQIVDRQWRASVTARCLREVQAAHAAGTAVTVIGPSAEDLEAVGPNVMDPNRRRRVLETSLRTSRAALADPEPLELPVPPAPSAPADARHQRDAAGARR